MKRVLFLYITEVSGHHSAVAAVEQALKLYNPEIKTFSINAFKYTSPKTEKLIHFLYMKVIKRIPQIWSYLYDNPKFFNKTQNLKNTIHKKNFEKIDQLINKFSPDAIVCSQAYPCGLVSDYKDSHDCKIPLIAILTDFIGHAFWIYNKVDYYVVACEETKKRFIKDGISEERIKLFGIPIHPKFTIQHKKEEIAQKLGLNLSTPIILIMGGGHGLGPVKKIIRHLDKSSRNMQIIVITGINKKLLKWLAKKQKSLSKKLLAFEFISNIDEIMEISTILISKPGGLTTSEALAKNLPLIIMRPIPGQETNNMRYLLKKEVAKHATDENELLHTLENLLDNKNYINEMVSKIRQIRKPESALDVAKLILNSNV